jgi:hypothetical protein
MSPPAREAGGSEDRRAPARDRGPPRAERRAIRGRPHARSPRSFEAGGGVLDHHAPRGGHAQAPGRLEEDRGIGLAVADLVGGDDGVEEATKAQDLERDRDVRGGGRRGQRLPEPAVAEPPQPRGDAGQGLETALAHEAPVAPLLVLGETIDLLRGEGAAEEVPQDEVVALAERSRELLGRVLVAEGPESLPPGQVVELRGIHDRPVEVPEDAAARSSLRHRR